MIKQIANRETKNMAKTLKEYLKTYGTCATWVVCGKGPSLRSWDTVEHDNVVNVNEAYLYTLTGLVTRYDDPQGFNFCHESTLGGVIPFMPPRTAGKYRDAYYYEYREIGLGGASCSGVLAVCLASALGAENIWLCGFDHLENGSKEYEESVMNQNNRNRPLPDQVGQFMGIPEQVRQLCRFIETKKPLEEVLRARVADKGRNLSM